MKKLSLLFTIVFGVALFACQEQDEIKPVKNPTTVSEPTDDNPSIEMGTQRGKTKDPVWN